MKHDDLIKLLADNVERINKENNISHEYAYEESKLNMSRIKAKDRGFSSVTLSKLTELYNKPPVEFFREPEKPADNHTAL